MKYIEGFRNPKAAAALRETISVLASKLPSDSTVNIMEVCGSHTMAIARYGIRDILPPNVKLISGPGCPVCVTDAGYIDTAIELARKGVTVVTFGDMLNVPGSVTSLAKVRSEGAPVEVCYSPMRALELAQVDPAKEVVFLAIGFETTIAPAMALLSSIIDRDISNISFLTAYKLVPPALAALLSDPELRIDSFLCPAHVSAIIGAAAYTPFTGDKGVPCVIAGFEPLDILYGLQGILEQIVKGSAVVDNQYSRVVNEEGNPIALKLMSRYLETSDASWRGIGVIPNSGLSIRKDYTLFDAEKRFDVNVTPGTINPGCKCGSVIKGISAPSECPMFGKGCTPSNPLGPCMVSSEGSCAAYYKYSR